MCAGPSRRVASRDEVAGSLRFTLTLLEPLTSLAGSGFGAMDFAFSVIGTNPDPERKLTVVALTNAALEGMWGKFTTDVRDAVYESVR